MKDNKKKWSVSHWDENTDVLMEDGCMKLSITWQDVADKFNELEQAQQRIQELEKCLRELVSFAPDVRMMPRETDFDNGLVQAILACEEALQSSKQL